MYLSIGTPENNKFSIWPKQKINYLWCPKIKKLDSLVIMFLDILTPKTINFPFGTNGKLMILGSPILKHFRYSALKSDKSFLNPKKAG